MCAFLWVSVHVWLTKRGCVADSGSPPPQREGKRRVFVCHSIKLIHPRTMFIATGADLIFYKPVTNGVLYVLKFKRENEKQHTTVNNYIMQLDETLKLSCGIDATCFLSINDDDTLPGSKVLSFDRDGRRANPLYRQLFGRRDAILPGVSIWNNDSIEDATELGEDYNNNNMEEDSGCEDDDDYYDEVSGCAAIVNAPSSKGKQRAIGNSNESLYPHDSMQGCSVLQAEKVI